MQNPGVEKFSSSPQPGDLVWDGNTGLKVVGEYDPEREQWLFDIDHPEYYEEDPAPSSMEYSSQPMVKVKQDHPDYPDTWVDHEGTIEHGNEMFDGSYGEDAASRAYRELQQKRAVMGPLPMSSPRTIWNQPVGPIADELAPVTKDTVTTPPSPTGVTAPPPAPATNGAPPAQNPSADRARIMRQQQVGGGTSDNPAYSQAQSRIREQMQIRRAHPLHQGSWEDNPAAKRGEIVERGGSEADNLTTFIDPSFRPSSTLWGAHSDQPMIDFKRQYSPSNEEHIIDPGWHYPEGGDTCETCYLKHGDEQSPIGDEHDEYFDHPYKPLRMKPGQRFSGVRPLFKGAEFDPARHEWIYNLDDPNYFHNDPAPSELSGYSRGLYSLKIDDPYEETPQFLEPDETVRPHHENFDNDMYRQNDASREEALTRHSASGEYHGPHDMSSYPEKVASLKFLSRVAAFSAHPLHKSAETDEEFWARQPDVDPAWYGTAMHNPGPACETCYLSDEGEIRPEEHNDRARGHAFKPFEVERGQRFSAIRRQAETDEEFWARQPDVEHGNWGSPDAYSEEPDMDEWDQRGVEEYEKPQGVQVHEHDKLGELGFKYDGDARYPSYHKTINRPGPNGSSMAEHHIIERNPRVEHGDIDQGTGGQDSLSFPWSHTYVPPGGTDADALHRGHNTFAGAVAASNALSIWGPNHPNSRGVLEGYGKWSNWG
ncbi:MAG TPA: hypothetical protein VIY48_15070 [Candidatus Paceibacterota bacterium]